MTETTTTKYPPLLIEPTIDAECAHLTEAGGTFLVGRTGQYAHIPRSGFVRTWPNEETPSTSVRVWCGQFLRPSGVRSNARWVDEPGDSKICGTCHGRAIGHSSENPEFVFTPRNNFNVQTKQRCVGSDRVLVTFGQWTVCVICGWFSRSYTKRVHPPEQSQALMWCPSHGIERLSVHPERSWRETAPVQAKVVCTAFSCEWSVTVAVGEPSVPIELQTE